VVIRQPLQCQMDASLRKSKRKRKFVCDDRSASSKGRGAHWRTLVRPTCPTCGGSFNALTGLANHVRTGCLLRRPRADNANNDLPVIRTEPAARDGGSDECSTPDDDGYLEATADDGPEDEVDIYLAGLPHLDPDFLQRHSRLKGYLTKNEREVIRFLMVRRSLHSTQQAATIFTPFVHPPPLHDLMAHPRLPRSVLKWDRGVLGGRCRPCSRIAGPWGIAVSVCRLGTMLFGRLSMR
jgi:hypothetical protein